jgi:hypothetical protein
MISVLFLVELSTFEVLTLKLEIAIVDSGVEGAILVFRSPLGAGFPGFRYLGVSWISCLKGEERNCIERFLKQLKWAW